MSDKITEEMLAWMDSGKTGASSLSIVAHFFKQRKQRGYYPMDAGDFDQCEGLLNAVPSLKPRLQEMASVNAYWRELVKYWDNIRQAQDKSGMIQEIIEPIKKADPDHTSFGNGVSLTTGSITFQGETPMTDQPTSPGSPGAGHNSGETASSDAAYRVTAIELKSFIERFERLDAEKRDIADQQKEVMAEAKGRGYDTKVLRKVISLRKRDPQDVAEEDAVLTLYCDALGMSH